MCSILLAHFGVEAVIEHVALLFVVILVVLCFIMLCLIALIHHVHRCVVLVTKQEIITDLSFELHPQERRISAKASVLRQGRVVMQHRGIILQDRGLSISYLNKLVDLLLEVLQLLLQIVLLIIPFDLAIQELLLHRLPRLFVFISVFLKPLRIWIELYNLLLQLSILILIAHHFVEHDQLFLLTFIQFIINAL